MKSDHEDISIHEFRGMDRVLLAHMMEIASPHVGERFLESLVRSLGTLFGARTTFVTRMVDPDRGRVRAVAAWKDGAHREAWEYELGGNPCELVYQGRPIMIPCDVSTLFTKKRGSGYESFIGVPLCDRNGVVVGHIAVFDSDALDNEDTLLRVVRLFAHRAEAELERLALERKHELLIEELRVKNEQLHRAAVTDSLTGLLNRRGFYERAEQLVTWSRTTGNAVAAAVIDLDGLKSINDRLGHEAGDRAIAAFAEQLPDVLTSANAEGPRLTARLGGDEFVVLCPAMSDRQLDALLVALGEKLASVPLAFGEDVIEPSFSHGVTEVGASDTCIDDALARADREMYVCKQARRESQRTAAA